MVLQGAPEPESCSKQCILKFYTSKVGGGNLYNNILQFETLISTSPETPIPTTNSIYLNAKGTLPQEYLEKTVVKQYSPHLN